MSRTEIDREKVIKGLQAHADGCGYRSHHCDTMDCPYRYGDESCDIEEMCRDALALLKEQEDKIRQLRLALQILNGNGIKVDTEGRSVNDFN